MKLSIFSIVAAAVAFVAAAELPTITLPIPMGKNSLNVLLEPAGNSLPVGEPFTITWTPAKDNTNKVTLIVTQGPTENTRPVKIIGTNIPNTGSFVWTPTEDLDNSAVAGKGYGILMLEEPTGDYQYTPQFGIVNKKTVSTAITPSSTPASSTATETETETTETPVKTKTTKVVVITTPASNSTTTAPTSTIVTKTTKASNFTSTRTQTTDLDEPTETPGDSESSAGRNMASFGMAGFLIAVVGLVL